MTGDYSNQAYGPDEARCPPRDEARDDFDVFAELSELWEAGGRARFTEGKTDLEWWRASIRLPDSAARRRA